MEESAPYAFCGAGGKVTGSKYLLEHDGKRVLVDCGLFQGLKQLRLRNWEPFPLHAGKIAIEVPHAVRARVVSALG
jgi:metallo-beta-lactamase family protein